MREMERDIEREGERERERGSERETERKREKEKERKKERKKERVREKQRERVREIKNERERKKEREKLRERYVEDHALITWSPGRRVTIYLCTRLVLGNLGIAFPQLALHVESGFTEDVTVGFSVRDAGNKVNGRWGGSVLRIVSLKYKCSCKASLNFLKRFDAAPPPSPKHRKQHDVPFTHTHTRTHTCTH